jgi:hypothetical protein
MKKLIMMLAINFVFISAFANYDPNPKTLKTFNLQFKEATNVNWQEQQEGTIATFCFNYSRISAFFNDEGELIATERSILFSQIPLIAAQAFTNRFPDVAPYEVTEYTVGRQTFYMITLELKGKKIKVRVYPEGDVSIERK